MNRKIIVLIGLFMCTSALFAAQQESAQPEQAQAEQKKDGQRIILQGDLGVMTTVLSMKKYRKEWRTLPKHYLEEHYGEISDNEPLIRVDYSSKECTDWHGKAHPKLNTRMD